MNTHIFRPILLLSISILIVNAASAQNIHDSSIKKNITTINDPLTRLAQLEPKVFEYNRTSFRDLKLP